MRLRVRVDDHDEHEHRQEQLLDPVYALQVLPDAASVRGASVSRLADAAWDAAFDGDPAIVESLRAAPRGSLVAHALVPGALKGTPKPPLERRARTATERVAERARRAFPAARRSTTTPPPRPEWILQTLLLSPEEMVVSLAPVRTFEHVGGTWPCAHLPAGLAYVELETELRNEDESTRRPRTKHRDDDRGRRRYRPRLGGNQRGARRPPPPRRYVPSSAYRKLLEAISCANLYPPRRVVDLGAAPGGWTAALRILGCSVSAVDRSDLAPHLANGDDPDLRFARGDAFTFAPEEPVDMMVSDVIAAPARAAELLETWCGKRLADRVVVTIKFRGDDAADHARATRSARETAERHGYECRVKHFFNNRHEVTLLAAHRESSPSATTSTPRTKWKITPMFAPVWTGAPKTTTTSAKNTDDDDKDDRPSRSRRNPDRRRAAATTTTRSES